jgi:hypothetical protein
MSEKPIGEWECKIAVAWLFEEIQTHIGERKARRLFTEYRKPLTRGERKNLLLVMELLRLDSRSAVAERFAKDGADPESIRKRLRRAYKSPKTFDLFWSRREAQLIRKTFRLWQLLAHRGRTDRLSQSDLEALKKAAE